MNEKNLNKTPKTTKKLLKIIILTITIIVLGIFAIGGASLGILASKMNKVKTTPEDLGITPEIKAELEEIKKPSSKKNTDDVSSQDSSQIINIALFGIDAGSTNSGRSDSIMILTIDPLHDEIKVASIMRDSYVEIPGYGMDKINHAFAFGDSSLALNTINTNFGLDIDKFVATNFTALPIIVDKLQGVEVNITEEELPHLQSFGITSTGVQTLMGDAALAYSRIRYTSGNDFERTSRHRTILSALYKKLITVSPKEYPSLLLEFLPLVETNLSSTELLSLGTTINKINGAELIEDRFPRDGFWQDTEIEGVYYLSFEIEATKRQLQRFIYEN